MYFIFSFFLPYWKWHGFSYFVLDTLEAMKDVVLYGETKALHGGICEFLN
jgi:hypothetical protein